MSDDRWIWIPNWDEFQHYKKRDPTWIKCYARLMSKDEFLGLAAAERGILLCVWLEYAKSRAKLRANHTWLSRRFNVTVRQKHIESLIHAGFIEVVASNVLAQRYQDASPEKEKEKESPTPFQKNGKVNTSNQLLARMFEVVRREWDEYPDKTILLLELQDRGLTEQQAANLIESHLSSGKDAA